MSGYLVGLLTFLAGIVTAAIGELVSEEVRDRLDEIPHAILGLAARMLDPGQRETVYHDEWVPELTYILKGSEARPITRLIVGTWYAVGIMVSTRRIARHLHRHAPGELDQTALGSGTAVAGAVSFGHGPRRLLIELSGARLEILERCPAEGVRFQGLGLEVLLNCVIATASMWFALNGALGVNGFLAGPAALGWGAIILGIDRWLVTSIPGVTSRKFAFAVPRLMLALLLSVLISVPLLLQVFRPSIDSEFAVIRQQQTSAFVSAQQHSSIGRQYAHLSKVVDGLEQVVDSGGGVVISPSSDQLIARLIRERNEELSLQRIYYRQWQCQLYAGSGCTEQANGLLALASHRSYLFAEKMVENLAGQIEVRTKEFLAAGKTSQRMRYRAALNELPAARGQLMLDANLRNQLISNFRTTNDAESGLLIRLNALNRLSDISAAAWTSIFMIFMLLTLIGLLPVIIGVLLPSKIYEAILRIAAERELREAVAYYRRRFDS